MRPTLYKLASTLILALLTLTLLSACGDPATPEPEKTQKSVVTSAPSVVAPALTTPAATATPQGGSMNSFVTRQGSQLMLDGHPFRVAGANMHWLGLDENALPQVNYPTSFRVEDGFASARQMGANVVRAHTLGISTGCKLCLEPQLGVFNEEAFKRVDFAIKTARDYNLRLIIPLTDNWKYYHGGKHNFTEWRGLADEEQFFTDPAVINDFKQYVSRLLNRVNSYTGIAYKDDPVILAWETGNEISPPVEWTRMIADYLKSLDPHHLVIDGQAGEDGKEGVNQAALALNNVDIYSNHFYPLHSSVMKAEAATVAKAGKVYLVGEFDWSGTDGGDALETFLDTMLNTPAVSGDLFWELWPHNDNFGLVGNGEGYVFHFPGDTPEMQKRGQLLRNHAFAMRKEIPPDYSLPGKPLITGVTSTGAIRWRGVTGGYKYTIERSNLSKDGPWTVICDQCASDTATPWQDRARPTGTNWYRIKAFNLSGQGGEYSPIYFAEAAART